MKLKTQESKGAAKPKRTIQTGTTIESETEFLAVDLEIVSQRKIDQLIPAFGANVGINRNEKVGKDYILLLSTGGNTTFNEDVNKLVNQMILMQVEFVHKLPEVARKQWDNARTKTFDIGIQAGGKPRIFELRLTKQTISSVMSIGGSIQFTIYAAT